MQRLTSVSKNRTIRAAALYTVDALEKRQLLCALHSGDDESIGTFPAPEPMQFQAAPPLDAGPSAAPLSALPQLASRSGATRKIFLDFDGANIPTWGTNNSLTPPAPYTPGVIPAYSADADATTYSTVELSYITQVWQNVAEKFSPFDVDVTTVDPGNRTDGVTMACVIGGTNAWYGSGGGVAYVNSFTNTRENTCFVWSQGSSNINFMGAGAAHELGHAFGLEHQGITSSGTVTTEYSSGSGQIVPIMGNANNTPSRRGIWFNGQANNRDNAAGTLQSLGAQDDLSIIGDGHNNFGYRPDDYNQASNNPTNFVNDGQGNLSAAGVINVQFDADGFKFTAGGPAASFTVTNAAQGGMLSPRAELVTYPGNVAVSASVTVGSDGNSVTVSTANLTPGLQYALNVHGDFAYGSVGQYTVSGTIQTFAYAQGGVLYVNGFENVADFISLDYRIVGGFAKIYVEDQINGIAAQTTSVLIPINDANSIVISTKSGYDHVYFLNPIGTVFGYVPASVDMGSDINNLELRGSSAANTFGIGGGTADYLGEAITFNDTVTALTCLGYAGDDTFIVTGSGYTNVALYGGDNNDTASITNAVVGAGSNFITFLGENGSDTLTIGDGGATAARSFTVGAGFIAGTGSVTSSIGGSAPRTVQNQTTETIRLVGSEEGDTFNVNYAPTGQTVRTEGFGGDDMFNVGDAAHPFSQDMRGVVNVFAGSGDDLLIVDDSTYGSVGNYALTLSTVSNSFVANSVTVDIPLETVEFRARSGGATTFTSPAFTSPGIGRNFILSDAAGAGVGSLVIDDRPVISQMIGADLYGDRVVHHFSSNGLYDFSIQYSGFEAMGIYTSNITNNIHVYGTNPSTAAGQQTTIIMGSGADTVTLHPHDAEGNRTINTNLGIGGGGGTDKMIVDDTASSEPTIYAFENTFGAGTQNIYGMGTAGGFGQGTDLEQIIINAGTGDDSFNLNSFKSGLAVTINGGAGNDTLNYGKLNSITEVTNMSGLRFDGQDDYDTINYNNTATTGNFSYTRNAGLTLASSTSPSYSTGITDLQTEMVRFNDGPNAGILYANVVPAGTAVEFNGNGGIDGMYLGSSSVNNLASIQGPVTFNGGAAGGNLAVFDSADTTDDVAHLTATSLGANPGDTLFGEGGALYFSGLVNFNTNPGITLNLGSGADTIYATPLTDARVTIHGNNPTAAPGDFIGMALADVTDPIFTPNGVGAGTWTSGAASHQALNYTGFESTDSDSTAPSFLGSAFNFLNGAPMSIEFQFDDDVSASLDSSWLTLTNADDATQIPTADIFFAWDAGTSTARFTFDNYAYGALPDGNYHASIPAGAMDAFGNLTATGGDIDFTFLQADAKQDSRVDTQDFNMLAGNFGTGTTFAEGDFTFDATIDSVDFDVFIAQYGKQLPTPAAAAREAGAPVTVASALFSPSPIEDRDQEMLV